MAGLGRLSTFEALFGIGYTLTPERPLRQPGNWLARERVVLEGPRGRLEHVAILGPLRHRTQVELSATDAHALGITCPVRESGVLAGAGRVRILGPAGSVELEAAIIAAGFSPFGLVSDSGGSIRQPAHNCGAGESG